MWIFIVFFVLLVLILIIQFITKPKKRLNMAHSEKRYCPLCKKKTTFICQDSGCFCSVCGYREGKVKGND